MGVIVSNTERM